MVSPRLVMIGQFAEIARIHAELTCRLHLGMREMMASASLDPGLELGRDSYFLAFLPIPVLQS